MLTLPEHLIRFCFVKEFVDSKHLFFLFSFYLLVCSKFILSLWTIHFGYTTLILRKITWSLDALTTYRNFYFSPKTILGFAKSRNFLKHLRSFSGTGGVVQGYFRTTYLLVFVTRVVMVVIYRVLCKSIQCILQAIPSCATFLESRLVPTETSCQRHQFYGHLF